MATSWLRIAELLGNVSEAGVYGILVDCLNDPNSDVIMMLQQAEQQLDASERLVSTRGVTGALAEAHFIHWFEHGNSLFQAPLRDCRLLQCGYDFEAVHAGAPAFVEVKGLNGNLGGILLTDKEWMIPVQASPNSGDAPMMVAEDHRLFVLFSYWHARHRDSIFVDSPRHRTLRRWSPVLRTCWSFQTSGPSA